MKARARQQLIHVALQIRNAGTLVAQDIQEIRQSFECIISGALLAQNFIHRWLQLIFHVFGFRGRIPNQFPQ